MARLWARCANCLVLAATLSGQPKTARAEGDPTRFDPPQRVVLQGYEGDAMEPFISRDGKILFFNNRNEKPQNTDIHYATRIDPLTFRYEGLVGGVNTDALEGVPTMDRAGTFYFVSPRTYDTTRSTLFFGHFANGAVTAVNLLQGNISRGETFWFNMDSEISADGNTLYFTDKSQALDRVDECIDARDRP